MVGSLTLFCQPLQWLARLVLCYLLDTHRAVLQKAPDASIHFLLESPVDPQLFVMAPMLASKYDAKLKVDASIGRGNVMPDLFSVNAVVKLWRDLRELLAPEVEAGMDLKVAVLLAGVYATARLHLFGLATQTPATQSKPTRRECQKWCQEWGRHRLSGFPRPVSRHDLVQRNYPVLIP